MSIRDHLVRHEITRRSGEGFDLCGGAAAAIGLLPDVAEARSLRVRTGAPPRFDAMRLGRTSVSRLQLGAFEATLPDTRRAAVGDWLTILLQSRGVTCFENSDHRGISTPGQIVMFDGNVETAINSEARSARIVVSVPKSALPAPVLRRIDSILQIIEPGPGFPRIFAQFLRAICRDVSALSVADRTRLDSALLGAVADLVETCCEPLRVRGPGSLARTRTAAFHMIETEINGLLSVTELAQRLECSERHLFLAFREVGTSPGRYVQMTRIKRARMAIETSPQAAITEIAYAVGFQSYSHFSRLFKEEFGISPRALRQKTSSAESSAAWSSAAMVTP